MKCPNCQYLKSRVTDSRPAHEGRAIRRRRECEGCDYRFTTFEVIEVQPLIVVKKDGSREEFNKDKLLRGLIRACEKRPVTLDKLEGVVSKIEHTLREGPAEVPSDKVGELVMKELINLDEVAYVRFASVYRQFKDISFFVSELEKLSNRQAQP